MICVDDKILNIFFNATVFYSACTLISSIFLMATFAVYTTIPEIRNTIGANVMCFAVSTVVAIILNWIMNLIIVYSKVACFALGNAL